MTVLETVAYYYDAWQHRHGDFGSVPLAAGFRFTGPVASFDSAEGYRAMAREAGQAVTGFGVRHQFVDLTLRDDRVAAITGFPDTGVFRPFGLPRTLPE